MADRPIFFTDYGQAKSWNLTDEGFLEVNANVARPGVQEYMASELPRFGLPKNLQSDRNAIVRLLRPEHEVFNDQSLESFRYRPVTNGHPPDWVDSRNYGRYQVGFSKDKVEKTTDLFVRADLLIQDAVTIGHIQNGKRQISAGYDALVNWVSGTHDQYGPYDGIQTQIKINHIAIVDQARAGQEARINDSWVDDRDGQGDEMPNEIKREIGGISINFSDQGAQAVDRLIDDKANLEKEISELRAKLTDSLKQIEELKARYDVAQTSILTADQIDQKVNERIALIDQARLLYPQIETAGRSQLEIQKEVIGRVSKLNITDRSDEYIRAAFETLIATRKIDSGSAKIADAAAGALNSEPIEPIEAARKKFADRSRNAWKENYNDGAN